MYMGPIQHYLVQQFPEQAGRILTYMQFVGLAEGSYMYRNKITRSFIVVAQNGELVSCAQDALHTIGSYSGFYPKRKYRKKEQGA